MTTASPLPLGFTGNSSRDLAFSAALSKVSPQAQQKAQKTSRDFEAVFLNSMFEQMTSGLKGDGPFGDTTGTGPWRAMMTDQFARHFAKAGGLGISSEVYRSLIVHQAAATTSSGASSS
ncbi:MAG: flagellar assembly peptidoglycan hydrolase FlgJ [Xanthobacteraceae bacterium]|nr:flagellar assembly peptidoglycan hydrolase FlgJ [Xanthobacteraceae bacterium]